MLAVLVWLTAICGLSLIVSPDPWGGAGDEIQIVILGLVFVAGAALGSLDDVMIGVGAGLVVSVAVAVIQSAGLMPAGLIGQGSPRAAGLFYNSEVLAETDAIVFAWAALRPRPALATALAVPLALCGSRIAVLAAGFGMGMAVIRPLWARLLLCAATVVLAGMALAVFGPAKLGSAFDRIIIWGAMVEAITPLGRGLGWVYLALPRQQFAHSDALQAVVEIGVPAFALAVIPIAAMIGKRGNGAERAAFWVCCTEAVVSFPLRLPVSGFLAALLAGFLAGGWSPLWLGVFVGRGRHGKGICPCPDGAKPADVIG